MILLEINTRVHGKRFDEISDSELQQWASLGFDWVWMMGIWRISPAVLSISKSFFPDFHGSPYAIADYEVSPELGGEGALRDFVRRAHAAGLRVMADFVPNHLAVDSPLIDQHPEYFIHSNPALRDEHPVDYFRHRVGLLAHGKDPHFSGWVDTVQLDYAHPGTRAHMVDVIRRLASLVDGLRCDMAMLMLREQVKNQWFPRVGQAAFDHHFPREFWPEAIGAARAHNPHFVFMAEVYWDKEAYLQQLGFDYTYNKKLYDMLAHHPGAANVVRYLQSTPAEYLARSVHFLENHDEDRAATRFGDRTRPVAILSYAIPGMPFVHQGQMEGYTEKLPVQRLRPLKPEAPDEGLVHFYTRLLARIKDPLFREGSMSVLCAQEGAVVLLRRRESRLALVAVDPARGVGQGRGASPALTRESPAIELPLESLGLPHGARLRGVDLWSGDALPGVDVSGNHIRIPAGAIPSWHENGGFLIELIQQAAE